MFHENKTALEALAQVLISGAFLGTLAINVTKKVKQHLDRMVEMGLPFPTTLLWLGFSIQAVGGTITDPYPTGGNGRRFRQSHQL